MTGKYTICRFRLVFFSLEMLQAGAVKGLSLTAKRTHRAWPWPEKDSPGMTMTWKGLTRHDHDPKRTHQAWPWPEKECAEVWWLCPASVCRWSPCRNISPPGLGTMAVHLWGSHPQTWLPNKKGDDDDDGDDDCFYTALFSAFEHTHCARIWFYMSDQLFDITPSSPSYLTLFFFFLIVCFVCVCCCCFFWGGGVISPRCEQTQNKTLTDWSLIMKVTVKGKKSNKKNWFRFKAGGNHSSFSLSFDCENGSQSLKSA